MITLIVLKRKLFDLQIKFFNRKMNRQSNIHKAYLCSIIFLPNVIILSSCFSLHCFPQPKTQVCNNQKCNQIFSWSLDLIVLQILNVNNELSILIMLDNSNKLDLKEAMMFYIHIYLSIRTSSQSINNKSCLNYNLQHL